MKTYIRAVREVTKGVVKFRGSIKPLEATDGTNGKVREGDICLVEDKRAYLPTSERFGLKDVLEINENNL